MNGAADSQHHGSQTPGQTQEETQEKALGAHAYGTGKTPGRYVTIAAKAGKARPHGDSLRWLMGLEPTTTWTTTRGSTN